MSLDVRKCSKCGQSSRNFTTKSKICKDCKRESNRISNPIHNKKNNPQQKNRSQKLPLTYVISNPAWLGWVKVGFAVNFYSRLSSYNTSSPLKDYYEVYRIESQYAKELEELYHKINKKGHGEWYNNPKEDIINQLDLFHEEIRAGVN